MSVESKTILVDIQEYSDMRILFFNDGTQLSLNKKNEFFNKKLAIGDEVMVYYNQGLIWEIVKVKGGKK